jgi:hypothetical protein
LIRRGMREFMESRWLIILLFYIIMTYVGYALVVVHMRYVWLNTWLMILMASFFIERIFGITKRRIFANLFFFAVLLLAVKRPFKEIFFTKDESIPAHWFVKAAMHPFETLWISYKQDAKLEHDIYALQTDHIIHGNIASLKMQPDDRDPYTNALRIARENNCIYFGQLDNTMLLVQKEQELQENKIDFLIAWNNLDLGNEVPVYSNPETGMKVYNCNK